MSTLGSVMSSATTSLQADQLALSVASNNISNSQTPGYARERLLFSPAAGTGQGISIGEGVDVAGIQALTDQLTSGRLNQETSYQSADDALQQGLNNIQAAFNDPQGTGMLSALTSFFNSFQKLAVDPTSTTNRAAVQQSALTLVSAFHTQSANLADQQQSANQAVMTDIQTVNTLTSQIASITAQIQQSETPTDPQNELRDQRSALVQQLNQIVGVNEVESNGNYQLNLTGSGQALVLNSQSQTMTAATGANGLYSVEIGGADITSQISSGDLGGQLQLRDQLIPGYQSQLDQIAYEVNQQVNAIHSTAYDQNGNTGINFFVPLSAASGAAGSIALSSQVAANPSSIAAGGTTASGDNTAALAIGNLLTAPVFSGGSLTDQYSTLVYNIGNDTSNAQTSSKAHGAMVTQLQNRLQSVSGVSIDEEATQILQFQHAYQASSELISAVNQMMQTALNMSAGK